LTITTLSFSGRGRSGAQLAVCEAGLAVIPDRHLTPFNTRKFPEGSKIRLVIKAGHRLSPFGKVELDTIVSGQEAMQEFWEFNNAISRMSVEKKFHSTDHSEQVQLHSTNKLLLSFSTFVPHIL
jgi:hypothetical protein